MASVKELKKDIDSLIFEVISDSFTYGGLHPDNKHDEVTGIIMDAVSLRNDLIRRVNDPVKSDDYKIVRAHFQQVKKDLFVGVDKLCKQLSALPEKKN